MTQPRQKPDKGQLKGDARTFYSALGVFNTNLVAWYLKEPDKVKDIIDWLVVHCPDHETQCASMGPRYMWIPESHVCARIDGEPPNGGGVG